MPVSRSRSTRAANRPLRCARPWPSWVAKSLADRWPDAVEGSDRLYEDIDGKARALFLRSLAKGVTLSVGLAERARRNAVVAADPQGDELPARRRLEQRAVRAAGARPRRAARRRRRAGACAGARGRSRHARPPLRGERRADPHPRRRPLRAPARRAGCGDRELRAPPRRDRAPAAARRGRAESEADRRRRTARRSDRAWSSGPTCCCASSSPSSCPCRRSASS